LPTSQNVNLPVRLRADFQDLIDAAYGQFYQLQKYVSVGAEPDDLAAEKIRDILGKWFMDKLWDIRRGGRG
jgi:hypothetical protein